MGADNTFGEVNFNPSMRHDEPAFPRPVSELSSVNADKNLTAYSQSGMTIRQYFAAKAMQGFLAHGYDAEGEKQIFGKSDFNYDARAEWCVTMADALIAALNSKQETV